MENAYVLSITNTDPNYIDTLRTNISDIQLSLSNLAQLMNISEQECRDRMFNSNDDNPYYSQKRDPESTIVGVFPSIPNDEDDSGLIQITEQFDDYNLVYSWRKFKQMFPEAETVDWQQVLAEQLQERMQHVSSWRSRMMYILANDGKADKKLFKHVIEAEDIAISWNELLQRLNTSEGEVTECARYNARREYGFIPDLAYKLKEGFVSSQRFLVVPDDTPFWMIQNDIEHGDASVITWTDLLQFFSDAVFVEWDEPGMPVNPALTNFRNV